MGDIKLFHTKNDRVREIEGKSAVVEKSLQRQLERNLEEFLGIKFLATEYVTGKVHGGRIDTLGIDENGCPVIIEYKRSTSENVINQGLFYLDWLLDHKAEFKLLVMNTIGTETADEIEWSDPRLLCIAGDYTKYDQHAVQQINRNIELLRYRHYGDDLLLLELVNATSTQGVESGTKDKPAASIKSGPKTIVEVYDGSPQKLKDLFSSFEAMLHSFGDDVQLKKLKLYYAFKRLKNFASVEFRPSVPKLLVHVKVNPKSIVLEDGFTKDVTNIGHWGTGDLEISIQNLDDLEKARPLLQRSYELN
jgi:predicted transport protein